MEPLFSAMHGLAAQRGDGLRPELVDLLQRSKVQHPFGAASTTVVGLSRSESVCRLRANTGGLSVETRGPTAILPYGQICGIRFDPDRTAVIVIGTKSYGHGYASAYFTGLAVARLGVPLKRTRVFYAGDHPAVKISFGELPNIPTRMSVGHINAQIGNLIECLCIQVVEKGRRYLASVMGVPEVKVDFDPHSGRFLITDEGCHVSILELARQAWADSPFMPNRALAD
jgi:hypothetical protein